MDFLPEELNEFVVEHTQPEPELLNRINRETNIKVLRPRMLSGHLQGRVLSMFCHMIKPKTILEIGTYTGYSAICMAEGLQSGGVIHTIDIDEELEDFVRDKITLAGLDETIQFHVGNALKIIPELNGNFDLVFIDADKDNYSNYFDLVIDRVPSGGYIIADNVLWSGKVVDEQEVANDPDTKALVEFCDKVHNDSRVQNVLFPVRDGLMVMRKL
jgi:predicted O-methyltransferase YrrM